MKIFKANEYPQNLQGAQSYLQEVVFGARPSHFLDGLAVLETQRGEILEGMDAINAITDLARSINEEVGYDWFDQLVQAADAKHAREASLEDLLGALAGLTPPGRV